MNVTVDDECPSVVSAGSRATLADIYDRALAGSLWVRALCVIHLGLILLRSQ